MTDNFYRAFEDKYRGSRELIKERLRVYLPFIQPFSALLQKRSALDLGCGRGEWLELLSEAGFDAKGVDQDEGMLDACRALGLHADLGDALTVLQATPTASLAVVSAFHVVEHLSFDQLPIVVSEALRVLCPGGLLIFETPNPENISVATRHFYLDPTHQKPIPPLLLSFVVEHAGFEVVKILRLQEPPDLRNLDYEISLLDVLGGVSPDYAVVAQKTAEPNFMDRFSHVFAAEYGLSLEQLASRHECRLDTLRQRLDKADAAILSNQVRSRRLESSLEQSSAALEQSTATLAQAVTQLRAVYTSRSWRATAPLRWASGHIKILRKNGFQLRIKEIIKILIRKLNHQLLAYPAFRKRLILWNKKLGLYEWLNSIYIKSHVNAPVPLFNPVDGRPNLECLTPQTRTIYLDLKRVIHKKKEEA